MLNQLERAINVTKKTGDKLIIFDSSKPEEEAQVIMPLSSYEKLIEARRDIKDLTEDELLDKINRDIAIWRSEQEKNYYINNNINNNIKNNTENKKAKFENNKKEVNKKKGAWSIPEEIKKAAKEVIEENEEENEENQYIEEIPF